MHVGGIGVAARHCHTRLLKVHPVPLNRDQLAANVIEQHELGLKGFDCRAQVRDVAGAEERRQLHE